MSDYKPASTPMGKNEKLLKEDEMEKWMRRFIKVLLSH